MKKNLLIGLVLSLLLFVGSILAYWWWYDVVGSLQKKNETLAHSIVVASIERTQLSAIRSESELISSKEEAMKSRFVQPSDIVTFISDLERSGVPYTTKVDVVSVSDTTVKGSIAIPLEITGSFAGVLRTFASIEYGPYALTTQGVSLDTNADTWTLRATVVALTATETP